MSKKISVGQPSEFPINSSIEQIGSQIVRLKAGNAIIMGGPRDVEYLMEKIDRLACEKPDLHAELEILRTELATVDPALSTFDARKKRQDLFGTESIVHDVRGDISRAGHCNIPLSDYLDKYRIEPEVVDLIGLDTLRGSQIIHSNYWANTTSPFIALLPPEILDDSRIESLTESLGFKRFELFEGESLALFIDMGQIRRIKKLGGEGRYLDKDINSFMANEAGNHGNMYFVGPAPKPEDDTELCFHYLNIRSRTTSSVDRKVNNLIGKIPSGSIVFVNGLTVLVLPPKD